MSNICNEIQFLFIYYIMKQEDIEEMIITANFMGWEVCDKAKTLKKRDLTIETIPYGYFKINSNDLKFHTSWDWLMLVVEKIEKIETFIVNVKIHTGEYSIYIYNQEAYNNGDYNKYDYFYADWEEDKLKGIYKAVVEFIKWYNSQKV